MKKTLFILLSIGLFVACNTKTEKKENTLKTITNPTNKVVLSSEIVWEKLNPARGDKSPQAGTIWGDRNGTAPTGFLVKFIDGFSSPPHIHNVTYRAVVIKGLIHNDDPTDEKMWMPAGSFWTQPAGEAHITASKGESIALVEIDNGPYLVKPTDMAFDKGERPVNIYANNVVWLDNTSSNWINKNSNAAISFLWRSNNEQGFFIKLPANYDGEIISFGTIFHAVVIKGAISYTLPPNNQEKSLDAGSYFTATDKAIHKINTKNEAVLYVRTNDKIKVN